MKSPSIRLTVMCSGSGTNLQALIDAVATKTIPDAEIIKVVVNRKNAYAIQRAEKAGISTEYFNLVKDGYHNLGEKDQSALQAARTRYDADLAQRILQDSPDIVILAGWMHVFTEHFLKPLTTINIPIINLHPALPGMKTRTQSLEKVELENYKNVNM